MNIILLAKQDMIDGKWRARLTGARHGHIRSILKSAVGDDLKVGLAGGLLGKGRITAITDEFTEMDIALETPPPAPLPITLVLALPRPIVFKRILSHVAALGVKKIALIGSARVEKSYWKSPALSEASVETQLRLGLEQAADTVMPVVIRRERFKPFVSGELAGMAAGSRLFLADPEAARPAPRDNEDAATVVIGPEGGFLPDETEMLTEAGCESVHFGRRILRVETAVITAISRLAPV